MSLPVRGPADPRSLPGVEVLRIERGHFGNIPLDGLAVALVYAWPGPIFEGNGELQVILDESASPDQRDVLHQVLMGQETDEGATHWWVYRMMSSRVHPPLVKPIAFEVDLQARTARVDIPGVCSQWAGRSEAQPARSIGCESRFPMG